MNGYSMPGYFQGMPQIGKPLMSQDTENQKEILEVEKEINDLIIAGQQSGKSDEGIHKGGQLTALERIGELVDDGTWCPLNSLYNPYDNESGTTSVIRGIGCVGGRWASIIAFDNKKLAGAWAPGQAEEILRAADTAKRLRIPFIYLLNCAGVKFDQQHLVYPNRRGGGAPFYRNAELAQLGIPVLVGVFGTNPAGGGYHSISPTVIIAQKDANMAVAGEGIQSGMSPNGYIDEEYAEKMIEAQLNRKKGTPPGSAKIHFEKTGFMREIYDDDLGVIQALRKYMSYMPAFNLEFFRVAPTQAPAFAPEELYSVIPMNSKRVYDIYQVYARLFDNSEFMEYKKGYGPEIVCGLAKVNGLLVAVVGKQQGMFFNYPEYRPEGAVGVGGKLYREGLIKMNEFVSLCTRDRIPIIWFQDTSGIDLDDYAEQAELLGIGQGLIYSIQSSDMPSLEITLRKASAAAHYVLGGPQGETNAFSIAAATSEYYALYGETGASAMYVRRLVKDKQQGKSLDGTIKKMNDLIAAFNEQSRPKFAAKLGMVDEIVDMPVIRNYIEAFTEAAYQNPKSICPFHQMLTVRSIREWNEKVNQ